VWEVVRTEGQVSIFISRRISFMAPRRAFPSRKAFDAFGAEAEALRRGAAMKTGRQQVAASSAVASIEAVSAPRGQRERNACSGGP
jgi:hypothetical protein